MSHQVVLRDVSNETRSIIQFTTTFTKIRPKKLMEMIVYDTFFVTVFKPAPMRFHLSTLETMRFHQRFWSF